MRPSVPDVHITDSQDAEWAGYRPLAVEAVLGLIFGLLSPSAMLGMMLWAVPVLGTIFSWRALRRMKKSDAALAGRKMAIAGATLSLFFMAAAPADWLVYRRIVADEARQFSGLWFQYVMQEEPQKAFQLTLAPKTRRPLDDSLWAYYRNDPRTRVKLEEYAEIPTVRTLLALGPKAQVRFYETESQSSAGREDVVAQLYAVTYEDQGERKSFFVRVHSVRSQPAKETSGWRVTGVEGAVRPEGW